MSKTDIIFRKLLGVVCVAGSIMIACIGAGHPVIGFGFVLAGIWMILDEEEL